MWHCWPQYQSYSINACIKSDVSSQNSNYFIPRWSKLVHYKHKKLFTHKLSHISSFHCFFKASMNLTVLRFFSIVKLPIKHSKTKMAFLLTRIIIILMIDYYVLWCKAKAWSRQIGRWTTHLRLTRQKEAYLNRKTLEITTKRKPEHKGSKVKRDN